MIVYIALGVLVSAGMVLAGIGRWGRHWVADVAREQLARPIHERLDAQDEKTDDLHELLRAHLREETAAVNTIRLDVATIRGDIRVISESLSWLKKQ